MTRLKRFASFEELKLSINTTNATSANYNEQLLELEAFLNLLRNQLSIKKTIKKKKVINGK